MNNTASNKAEGEARRGEARPGPPHWGCGRRVSAQVHTQLCPLVTHTALCRVTPAGLLVGVGFPLPPLTTDLTGLFSPEKAVWGSGTVWDTLYLASEGTVSLWLWAQALALHDGGTLLWFYLTSLLLWMTLGPKST